jgi:glyoxylase-like metal-dependent hydrolase (beta-lactamase superfamily II)
MTPRAILAPNASPMTMDGTITYLVGRCRLAIIDPGSDAEPHLNAVTAAASEADSAIILLTHDHPDHSAGAHELGRRLAAPVCSLGDGSLTAGEEVDTDHGPLTIIATPGHSPDHAAFHWAEADAVFCGDLMMGGMNTAVVAEPEGRIADYLESLETLRRLRPKVIYPSHGPEFTDPDAAIDRYIAHRREREEQVLDALQLGDGSADAIMRRIHGNAIDPGLRPFAVAAVRAYLTHLRETGRLPENQVTE